MNELLTQLVSIESAKTPHPSGPATWSTLSEICSLMQIEALPAKSDIRFLRRRVKAGQWVFSAGEKFEAVFIVHSGFLKNLMIDEEGNEQILGFPMRGDLLGMDGMHNEQHACQAVALTDCELVVIPFHELTRLGHAYALFENWLYRAMAREIVQQHAVVSLLGTLRAEARVARFLVSLSERFAAIGYSARSFNLRMTRQEIGSYLGLTLETVSRSMSALHEAGLIEINQRSVEIRDIAALRSLQRISAAAKSPTKLRPFSASKSRRPEAWGKLELVAA